MKTKIIASICAVIISAAGTTPVRAQTKPDTTAMAADAVVGRPLYFAATVVGSVIFVIALPVAATSGSIDSAAHTLVVRPAQATFVRPLGDFSYSKEEANASMAATKGEGKKARTRSTAPDLATR
jgi:hypothetical protein